MDCLDCRAEQRGLGRCALHASDLFAPTEDRTIASRTAGPDRTEDTTQPAGLDSTALLALFGPY